jgi:hypothetical protein
MSARVLIGEASNGNKLVNQLNHNAPLAPATIALRLANEDVNNRKRKNRNQNNDKAQNLGHESHTSKKVVLI